MLVSNPRVRAHLRGIARTIAINPSDREDLFQEMLIHLWKSERRNPGQTESWYLQSCKYHGLDSLKRGKSIDSKHRGNCVFVSIDHPFDDELALFEPVDDRDFREELAAGDLIRQVRERLSSSQQVLLDAFANGESVTEVSQSLGCSHQYVSKQRKKIAHALSAVLT